VEVGNNRLGRENGLQRCNEGISFSVEKEETLEAKEDLLMVLVAAAGEKEEEEEEVGEEEEKVSVLSQARSSS